MNSLNCAGLYEYLYRQVQRYIICILPTYSVYILREILTVNRLYCHSQRSQIGFSNGNKLFSVWYELILIYNVE